jgi:hypothetical protein
MYTRHKMKTSKTKNTAQYVLDIIIRKQIYMTYIRHESSCEFRITLVQELSILPEHPRFSGVRVTRSLALCVCFVDRCLSFCTLSFCHCR